MPRADGLRLLRMAVLVLFVGLLATIVMFVVGFKLIQFSREDTIRRSCVELNVRHDKTVQGLDLLLARNSVGASPAQVAQLQKRYASTLYLVNRLVPHQDCETRVTRLTK